MYTECEEMFLLTIPYSLERNLGLKRNKRNHTMSVELMCHQRNADAWCQLEIVHPFDESKTIREGRSKQDLRVP